MVGMHVAQTLASRLKVLLVSLTSLWRYRAVAKVNLAVCPGGS